jgi:Flp pilus assembly protein TadD
VLAERKRAAGDLDGAIRIYEAALAKAPNNVVIVNNLAVVYDAKQSPKAVEYAARAYKLAPKESAIADTYGWILFRQGKVNEALPLLKEALKGLPDNAEVQYHAAAALAKTGDKEEAARLVKKALAGTLPADQKAEAQKLQQQLSK